MYRWCLYDFLISLLVSDLQKSFLSSLQCALISTALTLIKPCSLVNLKAVMGQNPPHVKLELLYYFLSLKSTKQDLKWNLASLSTTRAFEHHPKLHSFVIRWRRSSLLWPRKFSNFRYYNFWKFVIFVLHGQYVYQMKAGNILNANLT